MTSKHLSEKRDVTKGELSGLNRVVGGGLKGGRTSRVTQQLYSSLSGCPRASSTFPSLCRDPSLNVQRKGTDESQAALQPGDWSCFSPCPPGFSPVKNNPAHKGHTLDILALSLPQKIPAPIYNECLRDTCKGQGYAGEAGRLRALFWPFPSLQQVKNDPRRCVQRNENFC